MRGRRLLVVAGLCRTDLRVPRVRATDLCRRRAAAPGSGRALRRRRISTGPSSIAGASTAASRREWAARGGAPTIPAPTTIFRSASRSSRACPSSGIPTASRFTWSSGSTTRSCTAVRCSSWKTSARSRFSEDEVVNLRNYLLKGGFLWVDDFWGTLPGRGGSASSRECFRPASIRSSTSRFRTRSCTRCTT